MTEVDLIMATVMVAQAAYITYQWSQITRYRRTLAIATYALEAAYDHIVGGDDEDADTI